MTDFQTIMTFDDYVSANLALQRIEERGISGYLADEHTVTSQGILSNALGGIKLRVRKENIIAALHILNGQPDELEVDHWLETDGYIVCPSCGSNNTSSDQYSKSAAGWSWLLLGFPLPVKAGSNCRCFYCGHRWTSS